MRKAGVRVVRARLLIESGAYSIYSPMMGRVLIYTAIRPTARVNYPERERGCVCVCVSIKSYNE